ncbi:carbon monoxide dehydrogenase subunit G [Arthrobacter sp. MP_M7]|nr:carbon monoxide dehydrogenase subunit G [Arthrobacter sp. MP_M4]MEC5201389.1 carbon monoxide dehydrogenase subunit G [Arthrobacter sp. MP_M7]
MAPGLNLRRGRARLEAMDDETSLTQHVNAPADKRWAVTSNLPGSAATLSGVDSSRRLSAETTARAVTP